MICGEGWPRATGYLGTPTSTQSIELEGTEEGFEQFLKDLASCLADPLTVQAVGHDDCCFPFAAHEWHVRPGCAQVEINDFHHRWDEVLAQVPLTADSTS